MKLVCIGRNYADHAAELGNERPDEPVFFLKPESALVAPGAAIVLPPFSNDIQHEIEVVYRISCEGKQAFVDAYTLGLDLTARDVQTRLKSKGLPWEKAKAWDGSAVLGEWIPCHANGSGPLDFVLTRNGNVVQRGRTADMLFDLNELIQHVATYMEWRSGDLLFTGTPKGVGPLAVGDELIASIGEREVLRTRVSATS